MIEENRYKPMYSKDTGLVIADMNTNPRICSAKRYHDLEIVDLLNEYDKKLTKIQERMDDFGTAYNNVKYSLIFTDLRALQKIMKIMLDCMGDIRMVVNEED